MSLSLKQSIDANVVLLVQGEQAIAAEETRATAAESLLTADLSTEVSDRASAILAEVTARNAAVLYEADRALAAEGSITAAVDANEIAAVALVVAEAVARDAAILVEADRALAAEGVIDVALAAESATRLAGDSAEATARVAGAADDLAARVAAEAKQCFAHTMEFQGILEAGSTPFAMGYGIPSKPGFGVYMPKGFVVKSWVVQSNSSDVGGTAELQLVHYPYDSAQGTVFDTRAMDGNFTSNIYGEASVALAAGSVVIHVGAAGTINGLVDVDARYRVTLYCQMTEAF